jgi:hypothetical protein
VDTDGIKLPQTVPSKWFSTSNTGSSVVLTGRGWGHGVGMVQYGAYGKALRGLSYDDILADYYGGLRPTVFAEPATIRVGIATGLQSVTIDPTGEVSVTGADHDPGPGPWLVTGKGRLHLKHGKRPPTYIMGGKLLQAPAEAKFGHIMSASVSVPELSVARLVFRVRGPDVYVGAGVTTSPGTLTLSGDVPDLPPGTYGLQVEVTNGTDIMRSQAKKVLVTGGTVPTPSPSPSTASPSPSTPPLAVAPTSGRGGGLAIFLGAGVVLFALAGLFWLRRRRRAPAPPVS